MKLSEIGKTKEYFTPTQQNSFSRVNTALNLAGLGLVPSEQGFKEDVETAKQLALAEPIQPKTAEVILVSLTEVVRGADITDFLPVYVPMVRSSAKEG